MPTQIEKAHAFRALHKRSGTFVIPNPWDPGSARLLAALGFEALTSTSAGFAFSRGLPDYGVGRDLILTHVADLAGPVLDTPLALCDARSVNVADLVAAEIRYPTRTGELYLATHNPRHRWWYASAIDRHEALVFKQYDSQASGVARFTPHAAFVHPEAPAGTPPRESIEIRCLVVYD